MTAINCITIRKTEYSFGLNAGGAGDRKVVLQFKFSGDVKDSCYFTIERGHISTKQGLDEKPDLTIETPVNIWMDIMTRKAYGGQMLMEKKYKVQGTRRPDVDDATVSK